MVVGSFEGCTYMGRSVQCRVEGWWSGLVGCMFGAVVGTFVVGRSLWVCLESAMAVVLLLVGGIE